MGERILQSTLRALTEEVIREVVLDTHGKDPHDLEDLKDKLTEVVRGWLEGSGALLQTKRVAFVEECGSIDCQLLTIRDYLPSNYKARIGYRSDSTTGIIIEGYDNHGWTLDAYVIPRLASGLIVAKEVS